MQLHATRGIAWNCPPVQEIWGPPGFSRRLGCGLVPRETQLDWSRHPKGRRTESAICRMGAALKWGVTRTLRWMRIFVSRSWRHIPNDHQVVGVTQWRGVPQRHPCQDRSTACAPPMPALPCSSRRRHPQGGRPTPPGDGCAPPLLGGLTRGTLCPRGPKCATVPRGKSPPSVPRGTVAHRTNLHQRSGAHSSGLDSLGGEMPTRYAREGAAGKARTGGTSSAPRPCQQKRGRQRLRPADPRATGRADRALLPRCLSSLSGAHLHSQKEYRPTRLPQAVPNVPSPPQDDGPCTDARRLPHGAKSPGAGGQVQ